MAIIKGDITANAVAYNSSNLWNTRAFERTRQNNSTDLETTTNSIVFTGSGTWCREGRILMLKPNTSYTLKCHLYRTQYNFVGGLYLDGGGGTITGDARLASGVADGDVKLTFTTNNVGRATILFYPNYSGTSSTGTFSFMNIQLNEGDKALPYESFYNIKAIYQGTDRIY